MRAAAADLEFEEAARLRDEIKRLQAMDLGVPTDGAGAAPARGRASSAIEQIAQGYVQAKDRRTKDGRGGRAAAKLKSGRPTGRRF